MQVQAIDNFGAVFTGYRGTVHFSSTDALATLPADYTFTAADAGSHTFNVTLKTVAGNSPTRDLTVRDTSSGISSTQNINLWFRVIATREGLVGSTTGCGHVIVANDHFVALPATGLCNVGVRLANGAIKANTTVLDVGPWCPNSSNGAGIDLADGTFSDLGLTNNAFIFWRFQ